MLATILVFTADEIWENLPADEREPRAESVHLALLPTAGGADNTELLTVMGAFVWLSRRGAGQT